MSLIITVGLVVALVLGIVSLAQSRGTSILSWAVVIGFAVLVLERLA